MSTKHWIFGAGDWLIDQVKGDIGKIVGQLVLMMMEIPKFSSTLGISSSAFVGWFLRSYGAITMMEEEEESKRGTCAWVCVYRRKRRTRRRCVCHRGEKSGASSKTWARGVRATWEGATTSAWGDWATDKGSNVGEGNLLDKYCKSLISRAYWKVREGQIRTCKMLIYIVRGWVLVCWKIHDNYA